MATHSGAKPGAMSDREVRVYPDEFSALGRRKE